MRYDEVVKKAKAEIKKRLDDGTYHNKHVEYGHFDLWENSDQINLWAYWQGHQIKDLEKGVDILLVGQDWGHIPDDPDASCMTIKQVMAGALETSYDPHFNPTNTELVNLFKILDCDITKPNPKKRLFFTNYSLGYRIGSEQGGMTKALMLQDQQLFRALVSAIKPRNIICLGKLTYECVIEETVKDSWVDQLKEGKPFIHPYPGNEKIKVFGVAHCGARGVNNIGGKDVNALSWKALANELC